MIWMERGSFSSLTRAWGYGLIADGWHRSNLFGVTDYVFLGGLLQNIEGFFLLAFGRNHTFAVEIILHFRQLAQRRTKIHQHPRSHPSELRDLTQHDELVLVNTLLKLLCPTRGRISVVAGPGASAKFTHDDGLLKTNVPANMVGVRWGAFVPANIFIRADHIENI